MTDNDGKCVGRQVAALHPFGYRLWPNIATSFIKDGLGGLNATKHVHDLADVETVWVFLVQEISP